MIEEGNVIRFVLQQNDGKLVARPAVVLKRMKPYNDCIVCGISKSIGLEIKGLDFVITEKETDFKTWGLYYPGVIREGFLFTISIKYIEGSIGFVGKETHRKLLKNLTDYLLK